MDNYMECGEIIFNAGHCTFVYEGEKVKSKSKQISVKNSLMPLYPHMDYLLLLQFWAKMKTLMVGRTLVLTI
jgi:hypothetical protein